MSTATEELHVQTSEPPRLHVRPRVRELSGARQILWNLVRKEVKVKYKSSVLGAAWSMLIFLAALQSIPKETREAAEVDGAGPIKTYTRVILPILGPVILFVMVLLVIGSFNVFTSDSTMRRLAWCGTKAPSSSGATPAASSADRA